MGLIGDLMFAWSGWSSSWKAAAMTKKRRTKKTHFTRTNENLRVLGELVALGWAELKAKAEAEGKPLPVEPPRV